ncbi:MAG: hypothetical protein PVJ74_12455 [Gammaproteobacteria bacterium]|mgnify:CR=1 FL=1|jgi:hypothetical protein
MTSTDLETDQQKNASDTGTGEKRSGTNSGSEILTDEERATESIARASLEVLKQASKILVPPTL